MLRSIRYSVTSTNEKAQRIIRNVFLKIRKVESPEAPRAVIVVEEGTLEHPECTRSQPRSRGLWGTAPHPKSGPFGFDTDSFHRGTGSRATRVA